MIEYCTNVQVSCKKCGGIIRVYPANLINFWDINEVEIYLNSRGWYKKLLDWYCSDCYEQVMIEETLYPIK